MSKVNDDGIGWSRIGLAALLCYAAIAITGWAPLAGLQAVEAFAIATGLVCATVLGLEFRLSAARMEKRPVGPDAIRSHRILGALIPVALLIHAPGIGYGYLPVLVGALVVVVSLGLAARGARALHRRVRWLYDAWFVTHIAASVLLVVLVAYHAVIAIAYE